MYLRTYYYVLFILHFIFHKIKHYNPRDNKAVETSDTVGIFNDGTELRINKIKQADIGDYLCVARNAEGRVHYAAKVVIAGEKNFCFGKKKFLKKKNISQKKSFSFGKDERFCVTRRGGCTMRLKL